MSDVINELFPHRPGYQPPDYRTDPQHHFPLTAPAVQAEGTVVERAHAAFVNAVTQFEKHIGNVDMALYTNEGAKQRIQEFTGTDAAKAVDTAVDSVRDMRDKAAARVEHLRRELSPAGDTAAELRATRYWQRTIRQLDAKDGAQLFQLANDAMKSATREELGTLLQELPSYLASRGSTTEWIDPILGQLIPEYGRAHKQLTAAEKALQVTEFNAKQMRERFALASPTGYRKPHFITPRYDPDR